MNVLCQRMLATVLLTASGGALAQQPDPLTQFAVTAFYRPLALTVLEQGSNSRTTPGYFGPRPPPGSPPHRYHFQIFALDGTLRLPSGANRHAVLKAAKGHVLAEGVFVGTFRKAP